MLKRRARRGMKTAWLTIMMLAGGTLFSSCNWADVRYNLVAGTQAFIKSYTTDLWEALIPPPEELINLGSGGG